MNEEAEKMIQSFEFAFRNGMDFFQIEGECTCGEQFVLKGFQGGRDDVECECGAEYAAWYGKNGRIVVSPFNFEEMIQNGD